MKTEIIELELYIEITRKVISKKFPKGLPSAESKKTITVKKSAKKVVKPEIKK